jgi:predicted nucleic acid-binding Zn ribbon protein
MSAPRRLKFGLGADVDERDAVAKPSPLLTELAPRTPLALAQLHWPAAAGEQIATHAQPVSERGGVLTVACSTAAWAQELDLMQERLLAALRDRGAGESLRSIRFTADLARHLD